MNSRLTHLFVLNCASIKGALDQVRVDIGLSPQESRIEAAADEMIGHYVRQFDFRNRARADEMAENYKIFYMLEADIRDFVISTLEEEKGEAWWDSFVPEAVKKNALDNRERELKEGVTPRSHRLIDYVNFGELGEIIKYNWDVFGGLLTNKLGVEKIMSRLNMLRAVIAHCGVLSEDEVLRLKLTVRDWFRLFEK